MSDHQVISRKYDSLDTMLNEGRSPLCPLCGEPVDLDSPVLVLVSVADAAVSSNCAALAVHDRCLTEDAGDKFFSVSIGGVLSALERAYAIAALVNTEGVEV